MDVINFSFYDNITNIFNACQVFSEGCDKCHVEILQKAENEKIPRIPRGGYKTLSQFESIGVIAGTIIFIKQISFASIINRTYARQKS
jgi:hypothetical protein